MDTENICPYDHILTSVSYIKQRLRNSPLVGIICGSGLGQLGDSIDGKIEIPYESIPNFPASSVKGHGGILAIGTISGVDVVCMRGRFHYYEGHPLWIVTLPIRVMKLLGIQYLIVTNAAGAVNPDYKVGDIMIIKDHINFLSLAGQNPLRGPNDERWGTRFPAMTMAYDREIIKEALEIANQLGMEKKIRQGVYACVGGPCYETIAEVKMLQQIGADVVGMSSAHEVIVAQHCGMKVFAISLVTNTGNADYECSDLPDHDEVLRAAKDMEEPLKEFVSKIVNYMGGATTGIDCPGKCKAK